MLSYQVKCLICLGKIKGTYYYWDAKVGDNINGHILGVEIGLNSSTRLEIGTENSNTVDDLASY